MICNWRAEYHEYGHWSVLLQSGYGLDMKCETCELYVTLAALKARIGIAQSNFIVLPERAVLAYL